MVISRRAFLSAAVAIPWTLSGCQLAGRAVCGSGGRPGDPIRIGILATTDMAPIVMAQHLGLYAKHGLSNVRLQREISWVSIRDKVVKGEVDLAHALFGIPFGTYTGEAAGCREIKIAMVLCVNGQALALSREMAPEAGYGQTGGIKAAIEQQRKRRGDRPPTFAVAFPGVINDLLLRSWLAAGGIEPRSVQIVTIPPPQTVSRMRVGEIDGFFVAEPWPERATREQVGYTHYASQDMWQDNPDKCLAVNPAFAENRRDELRSVIMAVLEASRWLDEPTNRAAAVEVISGPAYVNQPADLVRPRFLVDAEYQIGAGLPDKTFRGTGLMFHQNGKASYPHKSHAIWYLAQYVRFGRLTQPPDYQAIADRLILTDLYREAASAIGVPVPIDDLAPFSIALDKVVFDPKDVAGSLRRYPSL